MKLKWMYVLIICLMSFTFNLLPPTAVAEELDPIMQLPRENAHIIISNDRWMPEFKAGEKGTLSIPLENTSSTPAKNLEVSLGVTDLDKFPFLTNKMSFTRHISELTGDSLVSFDVTVPINVKPGTYTIPVNISYSSNYGGGGSTSANIYVKIINDYQQPILKVIDVSFEEGKEKLDAGQNHSLNLKIRNESDWNLKNIELCLSGFSPNGINLDKWTDTQNLRSLTARETRSVLYKIHIDPEMKSGTYPLDLAMKYKDEYDREYTGEAKVYIPVAGKDEPNDELIPRIIIDNYDFGGSHVQAGQVFALTLSLHNTSAVQDVKNVKVSLSSQEQVFSPVGSSNSFYIAVIKAQGRYEKTLRFQPKFTAEAQTYSMTADIDYQGQKEKYNEKEIISIPVIQKIQIQTGNLVISGEAGQDNPVGVSLDYFNTGKGIIRNLRISTEGDFEVRDGDVFIGNLESGKSDYYDVTIIPHKNGQLKGKVIFTYEDDIGQPFQVDRSFDLAVKEQPEPDLPVMPDKEDDQKSSFWKKWMIAPGIVVLAAVAAFVAVKRKRRKAQEEVDFDE